MSPDDALPAEHRFSSFREEPTESVTDRYPSLTDALRAKNESLAGRLDQFNVLLTVDEAEEIITTLYEVIGHMAEDVGTQGYEYRLLMRVRRHARTMQASLLASILPMADSPGTPVQTSLELIEDSSAGTVLEAILAVACSEFAAAKR
jgi:hypothetical protein